ncbi:EAL domain-containing protein [Mesorhizobium sp.]|uniref:bifunctional diguanylate cyclase/phosphodiesterase n=1 Tax=Mesorhizobium sp. TaxID=1871066 RepID=UPI000FE7A1B1|nr:EAL domain-containing protein [Mesorhizobium sp.]RWK43295.1 MAG: EAL domain-containing protein [Mesorhizobium sp.]RWK77790.1 MAG: EAL domain-containing protein [Mesorhizobium sp.]RWK83595.1 MAG: EAL domain-containing protein [Mesorhizobium sp.]RWL07199.1 MAG: EAL domain-containing protein [Mesorhizobium sp.]RWL12348.1 MAG: EAL domain-containing protein [Mesorhizobium sp.]
MAVIVIAVGAVFADHQNKVVSDQAVRADVLAKVNLIRAKLEGNINGNLQLVQGLVATVVTEPYMGQQRFASLASNLFGRGSQLKNIAGAPDLVISLMYPMDGNEKAIGLDYRNDERQRVAALRARDERELVLAGPVDLRQGGQGFVGRIPVFVRSAGNTERFWGIISAVVDVQRLYEASGLLDDGLGIDIALIGKDALGPGGEQFFGNERVAKSNPVTADVLLPSGSWRIAAIPKNGWPSTPDNAWFLRAIMAVAGALVVIPFLVTGRLIGERQRNYAELSRLSRRLELALEASAIGVWEHDIATNELTWDDRVNEIYGKPTGERRGYLDWAGAVHPDDLAGANADFDRAAAGGGPYLSEYRIIRPDGEIRHVRSKAIIYRAADDTPKMIGAEWDVTADVLLNKDLVRAKQLSESKNAELESAKARIEHIALHDSLTGLPNRRYLDQVLEDYAANARRTGGYAALLHIDLDRFKHINDTLGHAAGDAMLVHASTVLRSKVDAEGFVARIGGDEFVVLCVAHGDIEQLAVLADRVICQMREPVYYQGHRCRFGVSVGIAVDNGKDVEAKHLLVNADIALYRAKSRGRNRYEFFTEAMQSEIVDTKRIADEILGGLERNEFIPFYQPQFDAKTLEIVGVEALARWRHPEKGILAPDVFLRIAEELNVVSIIDRNILEQSLTDLEGWSAANLHIPRVSVNVSARRLQDEELIKSLRKLNIKKGTVAFELVESIFLDENDDFVTWNLEQIKELGIDVEIDDFGTGYASIVSLLKLQPRRLKIDRQLVIPIVKSPQRRQVVSSIIEIGKSLGIEVVAEGVETMEHAQTLKSLGCDILQGYAFGQALDADGLKAFVRSRRLRTERVLDEPLRLGRV